MKPDKCTGIAHVILDELEYLPESERIPEKFLLHVKKKLIEKQLISKDDLCWLEFVKDIMWGLIGDEFVIPTKDSAGGGILALNPNVKLNRGP